MFQKLEAVEQRYEELTKKISDPDVIARTSEWTQYMKEHAEIEEVVLKYKEYKKVKQSVVEAEELMKDQEMKELAEEEAKADREKIPKLEEELKVLLIPKDPDDDKNIICELRGGAGGDEAALFAGTLFRMYSMYAERKHWKLEVLNENETGLGGYKEISFMISGKGAYSRLKYESGVHRVQRVPETETQGRIHTSTATVLVMPEVDDVDVEIKPEDVRVDVYRSSGKGGQGVNTTDSAVRVTHIPTGIVVTCQNERSQIKNKARAMVVLKSRIYDMQQQEKNKAAGSARKSMIGTGDRSEKIRTYNYPQNRVTDHRINFSIMELDRVMDGNIEPIIEALIAEDTRIKMENAE